ncbi:hypothetical protein HAX54_048655 [Datura stramonium]|uniref:Uncharacterized protein n=1 Tax=Datura stramonium TaxID=4076 RepID=A0ABS8WNG9_DATST|nr:hypothetical protein [Datura stramonium]
MSTECSPRSYVQGFSPQPFHLPQEPANCCFECRDHFLLGPFRAGNGAEFEVDHFGIDVLLERTIVEFTFPYAQYPHCFRAKNAIFIFQQKSISESVSPLSKRAKLQSLEEDQARMGTPRGTAGALLEAITLLLPSPASIAFQYQKHT